MRKIYIALGFILILVIVILQYRSYVWIGDSKIRIMRTHNLEGMQVGLLGQSSLGANQGMLFSFDKEGDYNFHMSGMQFPIDFIWIDGNKKVIGITPGAVPQNKEEKEIKFYRPPMPAQYVIEVNAGWSEKNGIEIGDEVKNIW